MYISWRVEITHKGGIYDAESVGNIFIIVVVSAAAATVSGILVLYLLFIKCRVCTWGFL